MYQLGRPKAKSDKRGRRGGVHLREFKGPSDTLYSEW